MARRRPPASGSTATASSWRPSAGAATELEVRLVARTAAATTATISGSPIAAARDVDLLGRTGPERRLEADGTLRLALGPWEILTVRLRIGTLDAMPL